MAHKFDELNSRPARRREQQRAREAAKRRGRMRRALTAAAVLGVALLVVLVVLQRGCQAEPPAPSQPSFTVPSTQAPRPSEPETKITISFAGDLNVTPSVVASGLVGSRYDYTDTFMDVAGIFAQSTASVLNFEGNLCGVNASASGPQELANALADMGVDMVQMANSYTVHNGLSGLTDTLNGLRSAGLEPLGAWASQQEARESQGFTIRDVGGVRVAFVAFTKGVGSMGLPAGSQNQVNLLYKDYSSTYQQVDTENILRVLQAVQAEKPEITVALLHWGSEYNDEISRSQKTITELMYANGVDAIVGSHPHYVQQVSFDEAQGRVLAYSLGEFIGDAEAAGTNYGIILQLQITRDNTAGTAKITGCDYVPIFIVNEADKPLRVVRIREAMEMYENNHIFRVSAETYEEMKYAMLRIEARTEGE